ncbi:MAG TPA: recombinase family protein, partial [Candidatus Saccharimonadales bacterium]|nr:recombinase family protein [Candidatus Saccharimonadales bacterium]
AIDKDNAPLVKKIYEKFLDPEESQNSVAKYAAAIGLKSANGRPLSRSALVYSVLRNKFYIGINTWNDKEYPGAQETFIDNKLFNAVQDKLTRKTAPKYRRHNPDLKDIFFCKNCGGRITWEIQKGHWYGHCNFTYNNCPPVPWARQDLVEEQLMPYLEGIICPDPEIGKWIIEELKGDLNKGYNDNTEAIRHMSAQQDNLKRQLSVLYDDRLSGRITTGEYDDKRKEIESKIADVGERIANIDTEQNENLRKGIEIFEKSQIAHSQYPKMSTNEKKSLLVDIFSNRYINGKLIEVKYSPEAQYIAEKVQLHKNANIYFRTTKSQRNNRDKLQDLLLVEQYRSIWH